MTITLSPEVGKLVQERDRCGEHDGPDALVGAAVRRLIEEDQEEDSHPDGIRARVEAAEAEIDTSEYVEYDTDTIQGLAEDVNERGFKRLATQPEKAGTRG